MLARPAQVGAAGEQPRSGLGHRRDQHPVVVDADPEGGEHVRGDAPVTGRREMQAVGGPHVRMVEGGVGEKIDQVRPVLVGQAPRTVVEHRGPRGEHALGRQVGGDVGEPEQDHVAPGGAQHADHAVHSADQAGRVGPEA